MEKLPELMTAIEISTPGGPEVLIAAERPVPSPGDGELILKVAFAGVNRPDVIQRKGLYPPPPGASDLPGLEVSGIVVSVGAGVSRELLGTRQCALVSGGGYAEYCIARADVCLPVPAGMEMAEAAALPETLFTVWHNVFERGYAASGETVLIHAGASGVGLAACQIAHAIGATVLVTASASKHAVCLEHGASLCIDYRTEDFVERVLSHSPDGVQLVVDMVGAPYWNKNVSVLQEWGRIVFIGLQGGATTEVNFGQIMAKRLTVRGSTLRNRTHERKAGLIERFSAWGLARLASGELKPNVWQAMPMSAVVEAHDLMRNNQNTGKIVLLVNE
jgi:NADPH2:quinone reductase